MDRARKTPARKFGRCWAVPLSGDRLGAAEPRDHERLPFAREQETDADLVGLDYMAQAGSTTCRRYLWKNMAAAKEPRRPRAAPEFLSTHPSDSGVSDDMIKSLTPRLIQYNAAREAGDRPDCTSGSPLNAA